MNDTLPAAPFRKWVQRVVSDSGTNKTLTMMKISHTTLEKILATDGEFSVWLIDRVLSAHGGMHLYNLYPEEIDRKLSEH